MPDDAVLEPGKEKHRTSQQGGDDVRQVELQNCATTHCQRDLVFPLTTVIHYVVQEHAEAKIREAAATAHHLKRPTQHSEILHAMQPIPSQPASTQASKHASKQSLPLKTPSPGEVNLLQTYSPCYPGKDDKSCFLEVRINTKPHQPNKKSPDRSAATGSPLRAPAGEKAKRGGVGLSPSWGRYKLGLVFLYGHLPVCGTCKGNQSKPAWTQNAPICPDCQRHPGVQPQATEGLQRKPMQCAEPLLDFETTPLRRSQEPLVIKVYACSYICYNPMSCPTRMFHANRVLSEIRRRASDQTANPPSSTVIPTPGIVLAQNRGTLQTSGLPQAAQQGKPQKKTHSHERRQAARTFIIPPGHIAGNATADEWSTRLVSRPRPPRVLLPGWAKRPDLSGIQKKKTRQGQRPKRTEPGRRGWKADQLAISISRSS